MGPLLPVLLRRAPVDEAGIDEESCGRVVMIVRDAGGKNDRGMMLLRLKATRGDVAAATINRRLTIACM